MYFDEATERKYYSRRTREVAPLLRLCFLVGIVLNTLFLVMDARAGVDMGMAVPVRFAWSAALAVSVVVLMFRGSRRFVPWLLWLSGAAAGSAAMTIIIAITPSGGTKHLAGVMMLYLSLVAMAPTFRVAAWGIAILTLVPNAVMAWFRLPVAEVWEADAFLVMACILSTVVSFMVDRTHRTAFALEREIERRATTDALTGLANRHLFYDEARREMARMRRMGSPLSVIILDIDHFKSLNDEWGHDCGDRVLIAVGEALRRSVREGDLVARYGGEEFVILVVGAGIADALHLAERVRASIGQLTLNERGTAISVTASLGCSACLPDDPAIEAPLKRADDALYAAKASGRNQVQAAVG